MSDENSPDSLDDLDARIRKARGVPDSGAEAHAEAKRSGLKMASRVGVELTAALVVGVGIGLLLDDWLDTRPWMMIVFFILGAAAGFMNIYRVVANLGGAVGHHPAHEQKDVSSDHSGRRRSGGGKSR